MIQKTSYQGDEIHLAMAMSLPFNNRSRCIPHFYKRIIIVVILRQKNDPIDPARSSELFVVIEVLDPDRVAVTRAPEPLSKCVTHVP